MAHHFQPALRVLLYGLVLKSLTRSSHDKLVKFLSFHLFSILRPCSRCRLRFYVEGLEHFAIIIA